MINHKRYQSVLIPTLIMLSFISCQSVHQGLQPNPAPIAADSTESMERELRERELRPEGTIIEYLAPEKIETPKRPLLLPHILDAFQVYTLVQPEGANRSPLEDAVIIQSPDVPEREAQAPDPDFSYDEIEITAHYQAAEDDPKVDRQEVKAKSETQDPAQSAEQSVEKRPVKAIREDAVHTNSVSEKSISENPKAANPTREESIPAPRIAAKGEKNPVGSSSKENSVEIEHQIFYARAGDDIEISFDREGWLFLGYKDKESSEAVIFQSREYRKGSTIFVFSAQKLGTYELPFQFQQNFSATQEQVTMKVLVVEEKEFERLVSVSGGGAVSEIESYQYAERLIELGRYEEALAEYLKRYGTGSPYLNDRIADLSLRTSRFDDAIQYWLKNWEKRSETGLASEADDSGPNYSDLALSGIVRTCLAKDDHPSLLLYAEAFLDIDSSSIDRETIMMVEYLLEKGDFKRAKDFLQRYLKRHPNSAVMDQVLFLHGRIYEENKEQRNYKLARDAYARVYTDFPESLFADAAKEKADFLNRHFFFVR